MKRDIFNAATQARPPFVVAAAAALAVAGVLVGTGSRDDEPATAAGATAAQAEAGISVTTGAVLAPLLGAARSPAAPLALQALASGVDDRRVAHFQALVQGGHVPRYQWNFGDGSAPQGWTVLATVQHPYKRPGTYTVTLRVAAERGAVLTHRQELLVP